MNDKQLRQMVIDELDFEPSVDAANIGVTAENGVVTLSGHVASYAEKLAAEQAARRIRGVRAIAEKIEIRYPQDKKLHDDEIARRALDIIDWSANVPSGAIHVKVEKGWLNLTGTVDWHYQREAAESAVRRLSGVLGVFNQIQIRQTAKVTDIRHKIEEALKRNAVLEAGAIRVRVDDDSKVVLEGQVHAWYERQLAERAAWSASGVRAVEDHLMIA